MRHGKQIRAGVSKQADSRRRRAGTGYAAGSESMGVTLAPPPVSSRPLHFEHSRAGLLRCLAHEPSICRSVGLVR